MNDFFVMCLIKKLKELWNIKEIEVIMKWGKYKVRLSGESIKKLFNVNDD